MTNENMTHRQKLIKVTLPLEAINMVGAREVYLPWARCTCGGYGVSWHRRGSVTKKMDAVVTVARI